MTTQPFGQDVYSATLIEIGRIATTWAKFEHWIDQAIWALARVHDREGACITSQIGSIHGRFRALQALMIEAQRPEEIQKEVNELSQEAAKVVQVRNSLPTLLWTWASISKRANLKFICGMLECEGKN